MYSKLIQQYLHTIYARFLDRYPAPNSVATVNTLKLVAKQHGLQVGGTKSELRSRIFAFHNFTRFAIVIQRVFRGWQCRKILLLRGPGLFKRNLCVNINDFRTMDAVAEIPPHDFFSYADESDHIYGFHTRSFYKLLHSAKSADADDADDAVLNPFTRAVIPRAVIDNFNIISGRTQLASVKSEDNLAYFATIHTQIQMRAVTVFHAIDALGNYTNVMWFLSLTIEQLVDFCQHLQEIWTWRADLTLEAQCDICPPDGAPFKGLPAAYKLESVQMRVLEILERFVLTNASFEDRSLAAMYVIMAFTLVNSDAAEAYPWLFQPESP